MNNQYTKDKIGNLIIGIYLILLFVFYRYSFGLFWDKVLVLLFNGIGIIGFLLFSYQLKRKDIIIFVSVMIVSSLMSLVFIQNTNIIDYLTIFRFLGIVFILLSVDLNIRLITYIMMGCLLFMLPAFFIEIGGNVFSRTSQNYYSIILMLPNFMFNLSYWQKNYKSPIFPTIVILMLSIMSGGRGSIITYIVFLIGVIIINTSKQKKCVQRRWRKIAAFSLSILLIIITYNNYLIHADSKLFFLPIDMRVKQPSTQIEPKAEPTKKVTGPFDTGNDKVTNNKESDTRVEPTLFEDGFVSKARINIIKIYYTNAIKKVDFAILGYPVRESKYFVRFNKNLHNSFLRLHANYGLLGMSAVVGMLMIAFYNLMKQRKIGWIVLIGSIMFRVATDSAAFPGNLDILIYYIMFQFGHSSLRPEQKAIYDINKQAN